MKEVVSFAGVLKIENDFKNKNFDDIPENWKELITHYIEIKKKMILVKRKRGFPTDDEEVMLIKAIDILKKIEIELI